jgi:subtilisin-like proprotein convertase family protein
MPIDGAIQTEATEVPVAVSPGDAAKFILSGDICPAFSWGSVKDAESHELVVYRVGVEGEESRPVLRQTLAGSASSWTPSLDLCLARGGRYAWSVRAVGEDNISDWSPPSLFQVASGPSAVEFEEALAVVRQYIEGRHGQEPTANGVKPSSSEESRKASSEGPESAAPATTQLSVEGNVDATSFTGDGSNLAGVATDLELGAHAGAASAHHEPTVDTTCNGAACDGTSFANLNASNLIAGTLAEPRIDPAVTRDAELTAALEALDCPPGHFLAKIDGGTPVCLTPFLEAVASPSGGLAAEIPEGPATQGPATPYPSTLTVASFTGTLIDVNVTLEGLSHTYPRDLGVLIVAPDGKAVLLMQNVGGAGPGVTAVTLTFDEEAEEVIEEHVNPGSGSYQPSSLVTGDLPAPAPAGPYMTSLSHFDGIDPVGEWQLYVNDDQAGDVGNLASWSLELTDGTNSSGPLPIARGGTGSTDAVVARDNLGAASAMDLANHAAFVSAHHLPYTDLDAVAAMGAEAGDNALNHPRYTAAEVVAALSGTCIGRRWLDQGDGTVLDCNTRLLWLRDASCGALTPAGDGTGIYSQAVAATQALADGACGLSDGSSPGDWRLPSIFELCSDFLQDQACDSWAYATSLADTRWSGQPKVSNSAGDGVWTPNDPFFGVKSSFYWSANSNQLDPNAWTVQLASGYLSQRPKSLISYIWPVRDAP